MFNKIKIIYKKKKVNLLMKSFFCDPCLPMQRPAQRQAGHAFGRQVLGLPDIALLIGINFSPQISKNKKATTRAAFPFL